MFSKSACLSLIAITSRAVMVSDNSAQECGGGEECCEQVEEKKICDNDWRIDGVGSSGGSLSFDALSFVKLKLRKCKPQGTCVKSGVKSMMKQAWNPTKVVTDGSPCVSKWSVDGRPNAASGGGAAQEKVEMITEIGAAEVYADFKKGESMMGHVGPSVKAGCKQLLKAKAGLCESELFKRAPTTSEKDLGRNLYSECTEKAEIGDISMFTNAVEARQ